MSQVGFEPESPASEQPQTYALDRTVTGTNFRNSNGNQVWIFPEEPDEVQNKYNCQNILVITAMYNVSTVTGPCAKVLKEAVIPYEHLTAYKEGWEWKEGGRYSKAF